jgi:diaminohydroxyphosphoribosylaminopyrimidine deaminase/5-amino-6-(5-phosphoribosylamino)uracil reductase
VPGKNPLRIVLDPQGRIPADAKVLTDGGETVVLKSASEILQLGIQSILVEGGAQTMERLFAEGLVDEIWKIRSPKTLQEGISEPKMAVKWRAIDYLGDDTWFKGILKPEPTGTYSSPE